MARAQNSFRGLFAKQRIDVSAAGGVYAGSYSSSTSLLSADSTGLQVAGGIKISRKANAVVTGNATGVLVVGGLQLSGKTGPKLTANSTAIIASKLLINGTSRLISSNSTGIKIGARYLTTNTTGNL
jgi:hypothetical protein